MFDSNEWLAWAAGIIDGEGCIALIPSRKSIYVRIHVVNTDRRMLTRLLEVFSVGKIRGPYLRPRCRPKGTWTVCSGQAAEAVLRKIRPWLVTKGEQADIALRSRMFLGQAQGAGRRDALTGQYAARAARSELTALVAECSALKGGRWHPVA